MDWTANPCTGRKRPPGDDNDLQAEQPLSKKLAMLSIHLEKKHHSNLARAQLHKTAPVTTITRAQQDDDSMEVDNDNSNVVFVHNLDDELSSDEDEDTKGIVFLPDIEKKLTRVPYDIARGSSGGGGEMRQPQKAGTSTALVLYTVPTSLTVSAEQDDVKRAIVEARERIRKKQAEETRANVNINSEVIDGGAFECERDPDAMDIDTTCPLSCNNDQA
ncbi:uncharacterized protein LAJ45_04438 [Morchella importuna]|uniref:uncharacterized protein n=1 Tax=Morchella importuna TaxID=1174673 RepID=UPI001E8DE606|nr:uncharacterized protein LAJ45_04438 [Morchella importuna]KAH8151236.1 hypothetical protein LAJ45_04438 [Morchella importuna]